VVDHSACLAVVDRSNHLAAAASAAYPAANRRNHLKVETGLAADVRSHTLLEEEEIRRRRREDLVEVVDCMALDMLDRRRNAPAPDKPAAARHHLAFPLAPY